MVSKKTESIILKKRKIVSHHTTREKIKNNLDHKMNIKWIGCYSLTNPSCMRVD